jgi:hypothetical protein
MKLTRLGAANVLENITTLRTQDHGRAEAALLALYGAFLERSRA